MTTTVLLDVNVLIALVDPAHVQHDQAHEWFSRTGRKGFGFFGADAPSANHRFGIAE